MYHKLIIIFIIVLFNYSCSKKETIINTTPVDKDKANAIYAEAIDSMNRGDYFYASKKFSEAEIILSDLKFSAKAALMSSYCLYLINFYNQSTENLERFIIKYPADKNVPYAHYLIAISLYEQIPGEEKDITPLIQSRKKFNFIISEFPETEYATDLKFKLELINNQLAAKELYVAKYYIKTKKWIPAINRLRNIVDNYNQTVFIEEALHRLVEIYYNIGLLDEAKSAASLLGYNYNSSEWYKKSFKVLNKDYKVVKKIKKEKEAGIITRTIKKILD